MGMNRLAEPLTALAVMQDAPVIPAIVLQKIEHAVPMARALVAGGVRMLEVTLRTPVALQCIEAIARDVPEAVVGAGTVRSPADAQAASLAGARGETVTLDLSAPSEVDQVVLQEDIALGERVREHAVEGLVGGRWVTLAQGAVIGHKWIYRFKPQTVSALRLRVIRALAEPRIRSFACYRAAPPAPASPPAP